MQFLENDTVKIFTSFTFLVLEEKGIDRAIRHLQKKKIENAQWIPFFINGCNHWRVIIVNVLDKSITLYDSLNFKNYDQMRLVQKFLTIANPEFDSFSLSHAKNVPRQRKDNDVDCGAFVIQFCKCAINNLPMDFSQEDMPTLRFQMFHELMENKLIY